MTNEDIIAVFGKTVECSVIKEVDNDTMDNYEELEFGNFKRDVHSNLEIPSFGEDDSLRKDLNIERRDNLRNETAVPTIKDLDIDSLVVAGIRAQLFKLSSSIADIEYSESARVSFYEYISATEHIKCDESVLQGMIGSSSKSSGTKIRGG